jgi:hypothetical protein
MPKYAFQSVTLSSPDEVVPDEAAPGRELKPEPALFESGPEPSRKPLPESPSRHHRHRRVCLLVVDSWKSKSWQGLCGFGGWCRSSRDWCIQRYNREGNLSESKQAKRRMGKKRGHVRKRKPSPRQRTYSKVTHPPPPPPVPICNILSYR